MIDYTSLNHYLKTTFGCKVYKIALNAGFTCPNRDGKLGTGGCIFCSGTGSGDFAEDPERSITEQIEAGKRRVASKAGEGKFIAYFQAFTNTYAPIERLKALYEEALAHPDVVALSIATRPDCLPEEVLNLLEACNRIKPIWVELGLQTIHENSAKYIRRGYTLDVYDEAVRNLKKRNLNVITHVILGLPGETNADIEATVRYVCDHGTDGIKLQLLHILKGTDLAEEYLAGRVPVMAEEEYVALITHLLRIIPRNVVIHRMTGDGAKKDLLAPLWSADKKHVLNALQNAIREG
jgi:radical SAM protein (TIGR01212 family)